MLPIKLIACLLHIHLGIDDDGKGLKEIVKSITKHQTAAEQFHSFQEIRSASWHNRRDEVAQSFLDRFVRQNVAEIDEIPYEETLEPIILPSAERAIYLELDHHLQSFDMNIKKVSRTKKMNSGDQESSTPGWAQERCYNQSKRATLSKLPSSPSHRCYFAMLHICCLNKQIKSTIDSANKHHKYFV